MGGEEGASMEASMGSARVEGLGRCMGRGCMGLHGAHTWDGDLHVGEERGRVVGCGVVTAGEGWTV